jgi:hypothetical protein
MTTKNVQGADDLCHGNVTILPEGDFGSGDAESGGKGKDVSGGIAL